MIDTIIYEVYIIICDIGIINIRFYLLKIEYRHRYVESSILGIVNAYLASLACFWDGDI